MAEGSPKQHSTRDWFPFSAREIEFALGLCGFAVTTLALIGIPNPVLGFGTLVLLLIAYALGLLVYSSRERRVFDFIVDGALGGEGYLNYFRAARSSLFLTHTDDDPPNEELQGLYRNLLAKGVQIRRVTFPRLNMGWLVAFGGHPNLQQRIMASNGPELLPLSFAVVDEETVIVSVPGYDAIDSPRYATQYVLRHLIVIHDRTVAKVFLEMHRHLWEQGGELITASPV
jgi:hypothetical protein